VPLPRLAGLDAVKGLAILMVVVIHAAPVERDAYQDHFVNGMARLAVPLFLAISGYLAGLKGTSRARFAAYFRKFLKLHVIYSAFYWLLSVLRQGVADDITVKDVLLRFGAGAYAGQYYFAILVQTYFVAAFLLPGRFWQRWWVLPASALTAVAGTILLAIEFDASEPAPALALLARLRGEPVWLWFFYFALGATLGAREAERSASGALPSRLPALAGACGGVAIATLGMPAVVGDSFALAFPYSRLPIFLGSTLLVLALPVLARAPDPPALIRLGRESFGIFVFNPALLMLLVNLLGKPEHPWSSWGYVAITACGCLLIAAFLRRRAPGLLP
jgi:surface polysaccharide O-acyltransferase-like enzyme